MQKTSDYSRAERVGNKQLIFEGYQETLEQRLNNIQDSLTRRIERNKVLLAQTK